MSIYGLTSSSESHSSDVKVKKISEAKSLLALAKRELDRNEILQAVAAANEGLKLSDDDPFVTLALCYILATSQFKAGNFEKVQTATSTGLKSKSLSPYFRGKLYDLQVKSYIALDRPEEARTILAQGLQELSSLQEGVLKALLINGLRRTSKEI